MGTDGYKRISIVEQTEFYKWDNTHLFGIATIAKEQYQYHCICCGVIIKDELEALTALTPENEKEGLIKEGGGDEKI